MISPKQEQRLDKALDELLEGDTGAPSANLDPELQELLSIAQSVQSALADTPPPPHGLRPGRSAFLTAAANQKAEQRSRLAIPLFGKAFSWLAPAAAVLIMSLLFGTLYKGVSTLKTPTSAAPASPSLTTPDAPQTNHQPSLTPTPSLWLPFPPTSPPSDGAPRVTKPVNPPVDKPPGPPPRTLHKSPTPSRTRTTPTPFFSDADDTPIPTAMIRTTPGRNPRPTRPAPSRTPTIRPTRGAYPSITITPSVTFGPKTTVTVTGTLTVYTSTPTPSITPTRTLNPTSTPTWTPFPTNTPTWTPLPTYTPTPTRTPILIPTLTPTPSYTPTHSPTPAPTKTHTPTPTKAYTSTPTKTYTPTPKRTATPLVTKTPSPRPTRPLPTITLTP